MIRVVVDTNVIVSALLHSGSLPEAVLNLAFSSNIRWIASEPILAEYEEVLQRPRLAINSAKAADAITKIRACVSLVAPSLRINATSDPDDNIFLECAQAGDADYIVTGNTRHFPKTWQNTKVVTPRELIDSWTAAPDD